MHMVFQTAEETQRYAELLGQRLHGGEVLELVGDVGSGKTTFVKGLARGLAIDEDVQSPSFTISRVYAARDGLELHHYDFYRLPDPGIMRYDLAESTGDNSAVTVIEWAETVESVLPEDRIVITFVYGHKDDERQVTIQSKATEILGVVEEAYVAWHSN